jgi:predicted ATPase
MKGECPIHLQTISLKPSINKDSYPFFLPVLQSFLSLSLESPITIFAGENGTGKSTLLQGIAAAAQIPSAGGLEIEDDADFLNSKKLAASLKLNWNNRTRKGFFLRAEDFLYFTKRISRMKQDAKEELELIEEEYKNKSAYARSLAELPHKRTLYELQSLYSEGLDTRSHGEGFLDFFKARLKPNGLYLLDEPETPLSPMRQLSFMSMIMNAVKEGSQFLIVTHSPILMALPGAEVYSFDSQPPEKVSYYDLEHVQITKQFLEAPERFIKHL